MFGIGLKCYANECCTRFDKQDQHKPTSAPPSGLGALLKIAAEMRGLYLLREQIYVSESQFGLSSNPFGLPVS